VNRRKVKPLGKTHMLISLLALLGLAASFFEPWLLIITVLIVIVARIVGEADVSEKVILYRSGSARTVSV